MELIRKTRKLGNSAGVLLPKHWLGYEVKVIVVNKPRNIKKEILSILEPYMENITGIYLCGSYSRKEQDALSDINILAVSSTIEKNILRDKYKISIIPLTKLMKIAPKNPQIYMMVKESVPVLNKSMLEEIKKINLEKESIEKYIFNLKKSIAELKSLEEMNPRNLILTLKEIFILNSILNNKPYSVRLMLSWISQLEKPESRRLIFLHNSARKNSRIKVKQKELFHLLGFISSLLDSILSKF